MTWTANQIGLYGAACFLAGAILGVAIGALLVAFGGGQPKDSL